MPLDLVNPDRPIHVGVILMKGQDAPACSGTQVINDLQTFDRETEILDVAPVDLLNGLSQKMINFLPLPDPMKAKALNAEFHWVNQDGEEAKLTAGINLKPTDSFETCPPLDIVIMGANTMTEIQPSEAEIKFIRNSYDHCAAFLSVCGGFMAPLRSGIYEGKTVTAPRFILDMLNKQNPNVKFVDRRWQRDGKLWTSGTLLNGLDCMQAFVRDTWGPTKGDLVEAMLELGAWPIRDEEYKDVENREHLFKDHDMLLNA